MVRNVSRRAWLGAAGLVGVSGSVAALQWMHREPEPRRGPFGPLRPDPAGRFDLLEGFEYRIVDRAGRRMNDGFVVPARPDGMACFLAEDGAWVLMRNHEIPAGRRFLQMGPGRPPPQAYDRDAAGGVTRLVLDPESLAPRSSNLVLAGTSMNCSGGPSPHGWITCEEDPSGIHGFAFLCDPAASSVAAPRRLDGFGRFRHEAAAMNPETSVTYLSEDRPDSCFYRFVPDDPREPFEGRLQALKVRGDDAADTSPWVRGTRREIEWVDVRYPTPEQDTVRHDMQARGAAVIRRGEGICFAEGGVYLCATSGSPTEGGQIFRLSDEGDGGTLEVLASSEGPGHLEMPDNVTMCPSGTLYIVEDGPGHDYLRGVRADGEVFSLGRNAMSEGEIAGVCFSPDGATMFLNLQEEGLTLAIRGPFDELV